MAQLKLGPSGAQPLDIYYEDRGTGQAVVLLHGWPLASSSWDRQVTALTSGGFRVITHDRRGFGRSSRTLGGHDFDTYADDLHQLLCALDLHDVVLVGHGMGAGEAIRYLGTYGDERVARVALVSPLPPGPPTEPASPAQPAGLSDWLSAMVADRHAFLRGFIENVYNADQLLGSRISESALQAAWNQAADASMACMLDGLASWRTDFTDDLTRIAVPVLVIQGMADRIYGPARAGERMSELLAGSCLLLLEGAPHGLPWTHADQVNPILLGFARASDQPGEQPDSAPP